MSKQNSPENEKSEGEKTPPEGAISVEKPSEDATAGGGWIPDEFYDQYAQIPEDLSDEALLHPLGDEDSPINHPGMTGFLGYASVPPMGGSSSFGATYSDLLAQTVRLSHDVSALRSDLDITTEQQKNLKNVLDKVHEKVESFSIDPVAKKRKEAELADMPDDNPALHKAYADAKNEATEAKFEKRLTEIQSHTDVKLIAIESTLAQVSDQIKSMKSDLSGQIEVQSKTMPTRKEVYLAAAASAATIITIMLSVMALNKDWFSQGMAVTQQAAQSQITQAKRDAAQDEVLAKINTKLDTIIDSTNSPSTKESP